MIFNLFVKLNIYHTLSLILLAFYLIKNKLNKSSIYTLIVSSVLIFFEFYRLDNYGISTKLLSIFLIISYFIFTIQNRKGCDIRDFSSLDLLMIILLLGGFLFYLFVDNLFQFGSL